ncbi:MAG: hypothetical protein RIQ33_1742 [Bacteroidota bacterium]|jgi:Rps23 Pro-64 3,4-dihydroxylase Tpa1-like proline 4-hydroxylase
MENEIGMQHELIENLIYEIRGKKVMLDYNLAAMYGVETKQLKRQVRRNIERFPEDFMFELTQSENEFLRSQIGTLEMGKYSKYLPMAFTEQGVSMLSSVLNSPRAIEVNIRIIRIFTKLREVLSTHKDVLLKLEKIEKHLLTHGQYIKKHDGEIEAIFELIDELRKETKKQKKQKRTAIGFKIDSKK